MVGGSNLCVEWPNLGKVGRRWSGWLQPILSGSPSISILNTEVVGFVSGATYCATSCIKTTF